MIHTSLLVLVEFRQVIEMLGFAHGSGLLVLSIFSE